MPLQEVRFDPFADDAPTSGTRLVEVPFDPFAGADAIEETELPPLVAPRRPPPLASGRPEAVGPMAFADPASSAPRELAPPGGFDDPFRADLRRTLIGDEGYRDRIYPDRSGNPTFGYGHLVRPGDPEYGLPKGTAVSDERAHAAFDADTEIALDDARAVFPGFDRLPDPARVAIASMAYQMGREGLAGFADFRTAVEHGDWPGAYREMLDSEWAEQYPERARRLAGRVAALAGRPAASPPLPPELPPSRGERSRAVEAAPGALPGDAESPIPDALLRAGRETVADAEGTARANAILGAADLPAVGAPVVIRHRDQIVDGTVADAWREADGETGIAIETAAGDLIEHTLSSWARLGIAIEPPAPLPLPKRKPAREADAEAPPLAGRIAEYERQNPWFTRQKQRLESGWVRLGQAVEAMSLANVARELRAIEQIKREGRAPDWMVPLIEGGMHPASPAMLWHRGDADTRAELEELLRGRLAENIANLTEDQRRLAAIPRHPAVEALADAGTVSEVVRIFRLAPLGVIGQVGVESLPLMAPALAFGAAAGAAGAGLASAGAMTGLGTGTIESTLAILEGLAKEGVDIGDAAAVEAAVADGELMARVERRAVTRGAAIGAVDALAVLVAVRPLIPRGAAHRTIAQLGDAAIQAGAIQPALGASGEALAQAAIGEELRPGEIAMEAAGEVIAAPGTIGVAALADRQGRIRPGDEAPPEAAPAEPAPPPEPETEAPDDIPDEAAAPVAPEPFPAPVVPEPGAAPAEPAAPPGPTRPVPLATEGEPEPTAREPEPPATVDEAMARVEVLEREVDEAGKGAWYNVQSPEGRQAAKRAEQERMALRQALDTAREQAHAMPVEAWDAWARAAPEPDPELDRLGGKLRTALGAGEFDPGRVPPYGAVREQAARHGLIDPDGALTAKGARAAAYFKLRRRRLREGVPLDQHPPTGPIPKLRMKDRAPGQVRVGTDAQGRGWYTDGHLLIRGDPPKGHAGSTEGEFGLTAEIIAEVVEQAGAEGAPVRPVALRLVRQPGDTPLLVARLDNGAMVNPDYLRFAERELGKGLEFSQPDPPTGMIAIRRDGEIVGVVMPMTVKADPTPAERALMGETGAPATGAGPVAPPRPSPSPRPAEPAPDPAGAGGRGAGRPRSGARSAE